MKIVSIVGARPQFIKAAVLSRELAKNNQFNEIRIHTGQHFDFNMSDVFYNELEIPEPHYKFNIQETSHASMTGRMLVETEKVLINEKPEWVVVFGDTNSTLAGALAASKLGIKILHVEAGLRSYNKSMPEEINRILVDNISIALACPSLQAKENLLKEGFSTLHNNIQLTGDIMFDAMNYFKTKMVKPKWAIENKPFVLSTIHRAENTNDIINLKKIIEDLQSIHNETNVVLPLHPRTKKVLEYNKIQTNIQLVEPLGYLEMQWAIHYCDSIITDSGGLQKEAYWSNKKCLTLRTETEWVELLETKTNVLANCQQNEIVEKYFQLKNQQGKFEIPFYGDGNAAIKIIEMLT